MRLASVNSSIRSVSLSGTFPPWRLVIAVCALRRQFAHIESADRAMQSFEVEIAERLHAGDRFDGKLDPGVDQNLSVTGLFAQPRAEIHHRAVRRIMKAAFVADIAQGGMA